MPIYTDPTHPAFPEPEDSMSGLSIKEYFAIQICKGLCSNSAFLEALFMKGDDRELYTMSVSVANKLIEQLNKDNEKNNN